jgi:hypothetical protein
MIFNGTTTTSQPNPTPLTTIDPTPLISSSSSTNAPSSPIEVVSADVMITSATTSSLPSSYRESKVATSPTLDSSVTTSIVPVVVPALPFGYTRDLALISKSSRKDIRGLRHQICSTINTVYPIADTFGNIYLQVEHTSNIQVIDCFATFDGIAHLIHVVQNNIGIRNDT